MRTALSAADLTAIDARLAATDELLARAYPGDDGSRQPVHTVYVPADRFTPELTTVWGRYAREAVDAAGGLEELARWIGLEDGIAEAVVPRVALKLQRPVLDAAPRTARGLEPLSELRDLVRRARQSDHDRNDAA